MNPLHLLAPPFHPLHLRTIILQLRAPLLLRHLPQILSQDLAAGALGDGVHEDDTTPQLLVARDVLLDVLHDLLGADLVLVSDDVGTGYLVVAVLGEHADDGGVEDEVMVQEEGFQLCRGDLKALVLDKLL